MQIELSDREIRLIVSALYILETQCIGDELHYEIENDLGGVPDYEEIRGLMDRFSQ